MRTRRCLTAPALLSLLTLVFSTGCGSSATTSTATSPTSINRCAVTTSGNGQVPAQGGPGSLAVSAARECVWSASAEGQWLTIKTGATGQGDGAIEFNAAANPDPVVRRSAIVLNEQRVEVSQAAGECAYSLSEAAGSFPQAGGAGQFEVRASSGLCSWTAQSDAAWVSVRAGASSQGTATVQFDVAAAGGQTRSATITAAGLRFSIVQNRCELYLQCRSGRLHRRRRRGRAHGHGDDRRRLRVERGQHRSLDFPVVCRHRHRRRHRQLQHFADLSGTQWLGRRRRENDRRRSGRRKRAHAVWVLDLSGERSSSVGRRCRHRDRDDRGGVSVDGREQCPLAHAHRRRVGQWPRPGQLPGGAWRRGEKRHADDRRANVHSEPGHRVLVWVGPGGARRRWWADDLRRQRHGAFRMWMVGGEQGAVDHAGQRRRQWIGPPEGDRGRQYRPGAQQEQRRSPAGR